MKNYCITFKYTISEDIVIPAKTKAEALQKFKTVRPDETIMDVWEVTEQQVEY